MPEKGKVEVLAGILHSGQYKGDAGYDIEITGHAACANPTLLEPGQTARLKTGLRLRMGSDIYATVEPRSSVSDGTCYGGSVTVHTGIIDTEYDGDVGVIVTNNSNRPLQVGRPEERVAQIIFHRKAAVDVVTTSDCRDSGLIVKTKLTARGKNGFGSTNRAKKQPRV